MSDYIRHIRRLIGTELLLLPSTACIIANERNEVLLQCRSDNRLWGCAGGIMEPGETVTESLLREVREETGLTIRAPELFGIYSGPGYEYTYPNGDRTAIVQIVFLARNFTGESGHDDEATELRWFPIDALPPAITPPHVEFLRHFREHVAGGRALPVLA